jgi:hypothetical protein
MPSGDLDIQDVVVEILDVLEVLREFFLELKKILSVGIAHDSTKLWHYLFGTFSSELELAFADFL